MSSQRTLEQKRDAILAKMWAGKQIVALASQIQSTREQNVTPASQIEPARDQRNSHLSPEEREYLDQAPQTTVFKDGKRFSKFIRGYSNRFGR